MLARRPDLRWRAQPLPELQAELLAAAAERVKPGGLVVYAVCTLNADENEAVVDASGLEIVPLDDWPQYAHPAAAGVPAHVAAPRPHVGLLHRPSAKAVLMSLARAVEIARAGGQRAHPKPTVGAVLVRGREVVGEGVTEVGGRHAEVVALADAGERARGATMYVTLEPCAHHGTTPPCADAIVAAGVERVVVGARDPNPEAAGGIERLRAGGVEVEVADDSGLARPARGVADLGDRRAAVRRLEGRR